MRHGEGREPNVKGGPGGDDESMTRSKRCPKGKESGRSKVKREKGTYAKRVD
jgi:hypothetical protein